MEKTEMKLDLLLEKIEIMQNKIDMLEKSREKIDNHINLVESIGQLFINIFDQLQIDFTRFKIILP